MDGENPYAPPSSEPLDPPLPAREELIASTGQRFLNYLLDAVGVTLAAAAIGFCVGVAGVYEESAAILDSWAFGIGLMVVYYVVFEGLTGRTPGKLVTGTRVVALSGDQPGFAQVLGRTLSRFVPLEPLSFLGGSGRPVGWHDSWSKTRVVRTGGESRSAG